jgi:AMP nucleosidase
MLTPQFIATTRYDDPAAALDQVRIIYDNGIRHLRRHLQDFIRGDNLPSAVRACYPFVRVHTLTSKPADSRLSYGFVAGPGTYETTLTRPDLFENYYFEQFRLLLKNHGGGDVQLEIGTSSQPIPVHFSFAEHDHVEADMAAAHARPVRPARPGDDG